MHEDNFYKNKCNPYKRLKRLFFLKKLKFAAPHSYTKVFIKVIRDIHVKLLLSFVVPSFCITDIKISQILCVDDPIQPDSSIQIV